MTYYLTQTDLSTICGYMLSCFGLGYIAGSIVRAFIKGTESVG